MRRVKITLPDDEFDNLTSVAKRLNVPRERLLRDELAHLTRPGGRTFLHQIRILTVETTLAILREQESNGAAKIADIEKKLALTKPTSRVATWLQQDVRELQQQLAATREKIAKYNQEMDTILNPTNTTVLPAVLLLTFTMPATPLLLGVGAVLAAVVAVIWWRNPQAFQAILFRTRKAYQKSVDVEMKGVDVGAPRGARHPPQGLDDEEVLNRFWHDSEILKDRLQRFLDQRDGEERLRIALEDSVFSVITLREGPKQANEAGSTETRHIKIIAMTTDQYRDLPGKMKAEVMSRRSRPMAHDDEVPVRIVRTERADEARKPKPAGAPRKEALRLAPPESPIGLPPEDGDSQ